MTTITSFSYRDLIQRKLSLAVINSVGFQFAIIFSYVLLCNFNLLHPIEGTIHTVHVFTSFRTWICLTPFFILIFAESLMCGRDYINKPKYPSTRFQRIVSVFSVYNSVSLGLNILSGATLMWLFLHFYRTSVDSTRNIVDKDSFYLILSGIWNAAYYFYTVHILEMHLIFPVIYQKKILQAKSMVLPLLRQCALKAIWPTVYFIILHTILGEMIFKNFLHFFELSETENQMGVMVYFLLWFYGALFYYKMSLMRNSFNLYLTEPVEFCLNTSDVNLNLQHSLSNSDLPLVQHLAALDLFYLAQWSKNRRQIFFTLSQPGGHPHNWNSLVENVLKIFSEYIEVLSKSVELSDGSNKNQLPMLNENKNFQQYVQFPNRFSKLRNMSLMSNRSGSDIVELTREPFPITIKLKEVIEKYKKYFDDIVSFVKILLGIRFLFGEIPQANIQRLLGNGQVIIWSSQGIADLTCASLTEDKYGIVQKDLPIIITTLVNLKQHLDKLNKIQTLSVKSIGYEDFNYKMKLAILSAVKQSLFNIFTTFERYIIDLPLTKDVTLQLQTILKS